MVYVKEARNAIIASIDVWIDKLSLPVTMRKFGMEHCPLCYKYNPYMQGSTLKEHLHAHCNQCPVRQVTGASFCANTHYNEAETAHKDAVKDSPNRQKTIMMMISDLSNVLYMFDSRHGRRVIE